ncbi:MAG: hypothetical protein IKK67_05470 [Bacteroidaceae bacterium]|nr:hypothetical protein [Bacteroidaceae bacterium]
MNNPNIYPTLESISQRRQEIQTEISQIQRSMATCVASLIIPSAPTATTASSWMDRWFTRITLTLRIAKGVMAVLRAFRK